MTRRLIDWAHCRSFLAVMQEGNLSRAARRLALTQPTLGRHIAGLEFSLGIKLFTRSRSGLLPTTAAQDLLPHAQTMASSCDALARAASRDLAGTSGVVRLTASEFVGVEVLPSMLASFRESHPRIDIELVVSDKQQDLLRREADIAVRMVRPRQSALVAWKVGEVGIGLFAHRRYIAHRGMPADMQELARHTLIGFDRDDSAYRDLPERLRISRDMFGFRSDNDLAQLAALRAGVGIGGCQAPLAARDPDLVPVLDGTMMVSLEMWLAMHEDLRADHRVRLVFDHLKAALSAYVGITAVRGPGKQPGKAPAKAQRNGRSRG